MKTRTTKTRTPLLMALSGALLLAAAPHAHSQEERPPAPRWDGVTSVNVSGQGETQAAPDRATVRLGAQAQGVDATTAQSKVNVVLQAALTRIRALGIEEKRIRTENLSLFPVYENQKPGDENPPRITGYRASNVLAVEVENLTLVGRVIDTGLAAGINNVEGVSFDLKNDDAARAQALERAVAQAKSKAETLARALGMRLNGVVEVNEGGISVNPPQPMYRRMAMASMDAATPVQPGEVSVSASVTIRYRLSPL
jgi:uncharacterized protein YggE